MAVAGGKFPEDSLGPPRVPRYKPLVPSIALVRWVLLRLFRSPAMALSGLALLGGIPLLRSLTPVPTPRTGLDLALAWAFPAALLGIGLALDTLSKGAEFLQRLDPLSRSLGEWTALSAAGAYLQLPSLAGALLSGASPSDLGQALPAILTTDVLLGSVAFLSLLPASPTPLPTGLFLASTWVLPALAGADATLARFTAWLDVRPVLRAETWAEILPTLAAALGLALGAHLLRTAPALARRR